VGEKTCTELVVREVSPVRSSPKGHPYVECRLDGAIIAVWGSSDNMGYIERIIHATRPFRMICDCIPSKWRQHDLWVYERHEIHSIKLVKVDASPPAGMATSVSLEDLSTWRRQIATWATALEGTRASVPDGLAARIGSLSFGGAIPREIGALMKAVTEMRNAAEYDSKVLSKSESLAVRNAWLAVTEWASTKGLQT